MGGVETYVRELVKGLVLPESGCNLTLICNDKAADYFDNLVPGISKCVFVTKRGSFARSLRSILRGVGIDLVKREVDKGHFDLVHTPFTNVKSYRFTAPQIVTFLDLQHEYFPEFFSQRELTRRRAKFKLAADLATHLIAISGFTKQCVIDHFKIPAAHIDVVHLASNPDYEPRSGQDKLAAVRAMHSLNKPFLYYPAATWPHKNHVMLLAALKLLVEHNSFDGELVLTGISSQHHDTVRRTISELGLESQVRVLGYLSYEDMPYLFNLARLLVFPSLHEGFGIPLVEAMASGCPVVCANATSIPEVVGDAALMFDPGSPNALAEAIWSVWNDDERLASMREKGLQRAKEFSWKRTVAETVAVYRRIAHLGQ